MQRTVKAALCLMLFDRYQDTEGIMWLYCLGIEKESLEEIFEYQVIVMPGYNNTGC